MENKTLIIIVHRLETIKDVDDIYVLSNGMIKGKGRYKTLLEKDGYFTKLYKAKNRL